MVKQNARDNPHNEEVKQIKNLFSQYSIEDIANSLFVSSLWLPNLASPVQHQLFVAVLVSMNTAEFNKDSQINNYSHFKQFLGKLYKLTSGYPTLEDYLPVFDWGTVKYHLEGKNYKIFYGNETSYPYDFLMSFETLFTTYDKEYLEVNGRSPQDELKNCLLLQDLILNNINPHVTDEELEKVGLMHTSVPNALFWKEALDFLDNFKIERILSPESIKHYTLTLGSLPPSDLEFNNFCNKVFEGILLDAYFIKAGDQHYPVLPRRYTGVLMNKWGEIFQKSYKKTDLFSGENYRKHLTIQIAKFLRGRLREGRYFEIISAVERKDHKPHELVFSAGFVSRNKFILIYVVPPYSTKEEIEKILKIETPKLNDSLRLFAKQPLEFVWHLEGKYVRYGSENEESALEPELVIVLPQGNIHTIPVSGPKDLPGRIFFLDQFLAIFDEIYNPNELADFFEYLDEHSDNITIPFISLLDKFASFKDSYGVLVEGATRPDQIMLDFSWGNEWRYKSLSEFWGLYPPIEMFGHPRTWQVKKETDTRIRLEARSYLGCALYFSVGNTKGYLSSPFDKQSYEQGSVSNLLIECLEDYLSRLNSIVNKHAFFELIRKIHVLFFPSGIVTSKDFKHVQHLLPGNDLWKSDVGWFQPGTLGMRYVFDEKKLRETLKDIPDNSVELDLLISFLSNLDSKVPDPAFESIIGELNKLRGRPPRFKTIYMKKPAAFPGFILTGEPKLHDHKLSRKRVAEIAKELGVNPGRFAGKEAIEKVVSLREKVCEEINKMVTEYDFKKAVPFLLTRIDALTYEYEVQRLYLKKSLEHEVDFIREEQYSEEHQNFIHQHTSYRYLIEKFVQLQPTGAKVLTLRDFQYLVALVDKLLEIYACSDHLIWGICPVDIEITRDYLVKVEYQVDIDSMQKVFGEEEAKIELGFIGNPSDRVESNTLIDQYLNDLDKAFKDDFGFSLKHLAGVMHTLANWPYYQKGKELPFYNATLAAISKVCAKVIINYGVAETDAILNFLTLDKGSLLKVIGDKKPAGDLPVWEHKQRPYRYTIRPLIKIGNTYYWGAYSVYKSAAIWTNIPLAKYLPVSMKAVKTNALLTKEKDEETRALEDKALEIVRRYTVNAEKVNYSRGTHPQELGDYDVLAYLDKQKVLLNIECKDINPAFCLKDASRLKNYIFDDLGREHYLKRVEDREQYLEKNKGKITRQLGWKVDPKAKIISLYVSRMNYWWTKFPPRKTNVKFLRVDLLDNFVSSI